jgi:hypothetical protein
MNQLPASITIVVALLAIFLVFITSLKYSGWSNFSRTRAMMTSFFFFIVATLTISFLPFAMDTFPYSAPAFLVGLLIGYLFGVTTEQQKLRAQGLQHYMQHFAHIHVDDFRHLTWWSVINFYSVMGGLLLINLVGLSTVIFHGSEIWAILTSAAGAFLLGTIVPYLIHLWSVNASHA